MLDVFLRVAYEHEKKASAYQNLVADMRKLPSQELHALAEGRSKLASLLSGDSGEWLEKYEGTPLHEQALALEQECLEYQIAQEQQRLSEQAEDEAKSEERRGRWRAEDAITLKKRILDLELNKLKLEEAGAGTVSEGHEEEEAEEAEEEETEAEEETPEEVDFKEAMARMCKVVTRAAHIRKTAAAKVVATLAPAAGMTYAALRDDPSKEASLPPLTPEQEELNAAEQASVQANSARRAGAVFGGLGGMTAGGLGGAALGSRLGGSQGATLGALGGAGAGVLGGLFGGASLGGRFDDPAQVQSADSRFTKALHAVYPDEVSPEELAAAQAPKQAAARIRFKLAMQKQALSFGAIGGALQGGARALGQAGRSLGSTAATAATAGRMGGMAGAGRIISKDLTRGVQQAGQWAQANPHAALGAAGIAAGGIGAAGLGAGALAGRATAPRR